MFNCDDVATLLTKRKQKFAGSFARMDSILCELVVVISDSLVLLLLLFFSIALLLLSLLSYYLVRFMAVFTTNKDVDVYIFAVFHIKTNSQLQPNTEQRKETRILTM